MPGRGQGLEDALRDARSRRGRQGAGGFSGQQRREQGGGHRRPVTSHMTPQLVHRPR